MADYSKQGFTSFRGVNTRGSIAFRFVADTYGNEATLSVKPSEEAAYAWSFPQRSGTFPVIGTFAVNLPAVTSWAETAVTISGLRREDAFTCQIKDMAGTVTTGRTFPIIAGARPENGYVYLTFYNPTATATLYSDLVLSYTVAR